MSIPIQFNWLHPSVLPVYRSGRYESSRCVVPDYRFCLSAPAVLSCLHQYTDTGSAVCLRCFPESSAARPTGSGYGCRVGLRGLSNVFRYAGQGRRRRSHNADCGRLLNAYFAQAVSGIVMVILGTAGGLFAAGTSVFVVAVFQSAEAEQLIKTDQVLIAFFFAASSVQQVGRSIVLQGFPVCFVAAAFDVLITSVIILNLPD